ncbi:MAG TPA: SgcJ/EcaC family oxidoreductase [Gemmataceae bacterium]|jgi:uncharacterized protein (TIGR02246 family)|nr:SgcJ/EcaC family oxidoreductase [Gemmataceae bacterium]
MTSRKHRFGRIAILLIAAAATVALITRPSPNRADAAGQKGEATKSGGEAEIRKANTDYGTALTAADLDAIMAFWAPDADYIDESGKQTQGSDKIAELFKKSLADMKGTKAVVRVQSLKFIRPEICLEDGVVERTAATGIKETNRFAIVWTKTGDKWLISNVRDLPTEATDLPSIAAGALADLGWLVGEWTGEGDKTAVNLKITWAANKAFLLMDYSIKQENADPLDVTVRVGWDPRQARIRSWVFDSTGGFAEAFWAKDGKRWVVGTSGVLPDGGTGGATNIFEFVDENSILWRSTERDVDGQPLADAEVKFVRKGAKK